MSLYEKARPGEIKVLPDGGGHRNDRVDAPPRGHVLSTRAVPLHESLDFWHDAVLDQLVGMDITTEGGTYDAQMRADRLGGLRITTVECDPGTVHRSPRYIARGDGREVFAAVLASGRAQVEQDGRTTEMHPGDVTFFETVRPFRTHFPHRFRLDVFAVSRARLGLPEAELHRITARALRPARGLGSLLSPFLTRLADTSQVYAQPVAEHLADSAVELLAAVAAEQAGGEPTELPGAERVLLLRVQRFIRWHLAAPDLTPETVARAHHISVRYLHRLFQGEGTSVSRWIREMRLHECRRELEASVDRWAGGTPDARTPLSAVARRWGFTGASHFARAFRREYGMSPTEWLRGEQARRSVPELC
ncbi:AraC-like ligand-binding domain-containing protein [Streptomyces sp. NPDC055721]|uniref:AraC-like ligand-binding domain-containing protein n=1 Tax=Streptomyces sp. NPDC127132 TaxID=3345374 RepID=UPI0036307B95